MRTSKGAAPKPDETPLERAKRLALEYLQRPHSEKQLRDRLLEKGCAGPDVDAVAALCADYGFVNDGEYAGMVARYYDARGYGPGRIRQEFTRRGVPKEYWDDALEALDRHDDAVDRLLALRLRGRDPGDRKELKKATDALFRRGYSWEEIQSAVNRYKS